MDDVAMQMSFVDPQVSFMQAFGLGREEIRKYLKEKQQKISKKFRGAGSLFTIGVPQGMPISPFMAILPLKECFLNERIGSKFEDYVIYADDPIFFSNSPIKVNGNPEMGIHPHEVGEKAGYIKYDGKYTERGLKFLGLRLKDESKL